MAVTLTDYSAFPFSIEGAEIGKGLTKLEWMKGQVAAGLLSNIGTHSDMGPLAWEIHLMAEYLLDPERSKKEWEKSKETDKPGWAK